MSASVQEFLTEVLDLSKVAELNSQDFNICFFLRFDNWDAVGSMGKNGHFGNSSQLF